MSVVGYAGAAALGGVLAFGFLDVPSEWRIEVALGAAAGMWVYREIENDPEASAELNLGLDVMWAFPYLFWGGVVVLAAGFNLFFNLILAPEFEVLTAILPVKQQALGMVSFVLAFAGMIVEADLFAWPFCVGYWIVTGGYDGGQNYMPYILGQASGPTASKSPPLPPVIPSDDGNVNSILARSVNVYNLDSAFRLWYLPVDLFWYFVATPCEIIDAVQSCIKGGTIFPALLLPLAIGQRQWSELTCCVLDLLAFEHDVQGFVDWIKGSFTAGGIAKRVVGEAKSVLKWIEHLF